MGNLVGIYRGSFDPPHLGHLDTVNAALRHGVNRIVITFIDPNSNKPERSHNQIRLTLLQALFRSCTQVIISEKPFRAALLDLVEDHTVLKVRLIIGSDLLQASFRQFPSSEKLDCLMIPREDYVLEDNPKTWNGLPMSVVPENKPYDQRWSSTQIRTYLARNQLIPASQPLTTPLLEIILSQGWYGTILKCEAEKRIPAAYHPISVQLLEGGASGDLVFSIKGRDRSCKFVAKVFANPQRFESELQGHRVLNKLPTKYVRIPEIYFADQQIILMQFVHGKSLAHMMQYSPAAIQLCAKADLELHLAATTPAEVNPTIYESRLAQIDALSPEVAAKLAPQWKKLTQKFLQNPGLHSFVHGDPNHFNAFVDLETQTVTYFDLCKFSPKGFAMEEFYESQLCFKIAARRLGGIDANKLAAIRDLYSKTYFEQAPKAIATAEARQFFQASWKLCVIKRLLSLGKNPEKEIHAFLHLTI